MTAKDLIRAGIGRLDELVNGVHCEARVLGPERLAVSVSGFNISDVVDAPFFETQGLGNDGSEIDAKISILADFERYTQGILRSSGPRHYSGLFPYSHIYRDAENAFEIARRAGVPLDFTTVLVLVGHDIIEDKKTIRDLQDSYAEAIFKRDHERRKEISWELKRERVLARNEIETELNIYLRKTGAKGKLREDLRRDIRTAADLILDLTRFKDIYHYATSMNRQYGRLGPESLEKVSIRSFVKNTDRITNLKEYGLIVTPATMKGIARAFADERQLVGEYNVGNFLRHTYGEVRDSGIDMPPAVMVLTAFNSLFPLQFQNQMLNSQAESPILVDPRLQDLVKLVLTSRQETISATTNLIGLATRQYERGLERRDIEDVSDQTVARKSDRYFYEVTLDGFIKDWMVYDAGGRKTVEALDASAERRFKTYRDAVELAVQVAMFDRFYERGNLDAMRRPVLIEDNSVAYDPRRHDYFTLKGVSDILRFVKGDRFWEMVARAKKQYNPAPRTAAGAFTSFI